MLDSEVLPTAILVDLLEPCFDAGKQRDVVAMLLQHPPRYGHVVSLCRLQHEVHVGKNLTAVLGPRLFPHLRPKCRRIGHTDGWEKTVLREVVGREGAVEVIDDGCAERCSH